MRTPSATFAVSRLDDRLTYGVAMLLGATSFFEGATTHLPAFVLRAGVMGLAVHAWPRRGAHLERRTACVLAGLVAAYSWGLVRSEQWGLGVQPWVTLIAAIMAFVALDAQPEAAQTGARDGLFHIAALHSVWALCQKLQLMHSPTSRAMGGFFSPIDLAAFLAPMAIWAMGAASRAPSQASRRGYAALAALITLGLLTTRSRGGILAWALGLGLAFVWGGSAHPWRQIFGPRPSAARLSVGLAAGAGLVGAAGMALRYRFNTAYDADAFSRIQIWHACLRLLAAHPLGLGTGGVEDAMRLEGVPTAHAVRYLHVANNAHNTFLHTALECGVVGVAAWGLFLTAAALGLWRRRTGAHRWHAAVAAALLFPALTATTWQLTLMACVMALWAAQQSPRQTHGATEAHLALVPIGTRSVWAVIALSASCMLAPGALSQLCLMQARRLADGHADPGAVRAWAQRATMLAPWSVNTALMAEHLRTLPPHAPSAVDQAEALVALADIYPHSPEPLRQAATLLASAAKTPDQHTQAANLWQWTAARDPHNALYWLYAGRAAAAGHVPGGAPALFAQALAQEPHCAGAWLGLAEQAHSRGDTAALEHALEEVIASIHLAQGQQGFARSVLTLDADAQIRFNQLMHTLKEPS